MPDVCLRLAGLLPAVQQRQHAKHMQVNGDVLHAVHCTLCGNIPMPWQAWQ